MPKRRNKGRKKKWESGDSQENQQRVEQVADGVQQQGGLSVGSILATAGVLALSGLQMVGGAFTLGTACSSLFNSNNCTVFNDRRTNCTDELNEAVSGSSDGTVVKNQGLMFDAGGPMCIVSAIRNISSICSRDNSTSLASSLRRVKENCEGKVNATLSPDVVKNFLENSTKVFTSCNMVGGNTTAAGCTSATTVSGLKTSNSDGNWDVQSNPTDGIWCGLVATGLICLVFLSSVLYYLYKEHCGNDGQDQSQELDEVVTQGGGPGNGNGKYPGVREQLLKGKCGNGQNKSPGGKSKNKQKHFAR